MKIETRGKYPGVKLHLEPEEVQAVVVLSTLDHADDLYQIALPDTLSTLRKMGLKIQKLLEETPGLLEERTPEQVAAIMVKEIEKQTLQLAALKAGSEWKKVDPSVLKEKLLAHVKEKE